MLVFYTIDKNKEGDSIENSLDKLEAWILHFHQGLHLKN